MRASSTRIAIALLAALPAVVVADGLHPDDVIKLRRAAFALQGYYFVQLRPMATGKQPFEAAIARRFTTRIEALSQMAPEFFLPGSDKGDTKAKAAIWTDKDDFNGKQQRSIDELHKLAAAAQAGDAAAFSAQFMVATESCKDCHETYRER